eukprot:Amastigsp_a341308_26.p4 type:complete len:175 gc:universal Amastigsp_a341308_26:801-1325(+)
MHWRMSSALTPDGVCFLTRASTARSFSLISRSTCGRGLPSAKISIVAVGSRGSCSRASAPRRTSSLYTLLTSLKSETPSISFTSARSESCSMWIILPYSVRMRSGFMILWRRATSNTRRRNCGTFSISKLIVSTTSRPTSMSTPETRPFMMAATDRHWAWMRFTGFISASTVEV